MRELVELVDMRDDVEAASEAIPPSPLDLVCGGVTVRLDASTSVTHCRESPRLECVLMMFPSNRVRIIVATKPVDFRNYAERMIMQSGWRLISRCQPLISKRWLSPTYFPPVVSENSSLF